MDSENNNSTDANIGNFEQLKRKIFGIFSLIVAVSFFLLFIYLGLNRWWQLLLFFPFLSGLLGLLQAKEKT